MILRSRSLFRTLPILFGFFLAGCAYHGPDVDPNVGLKERTTLYGRVIDEAGSPLPGAQIQSGSTSTISDEGGYFILKDAPVPKGRAIIVAKKSGYFAAYRAVVPQASGTRVAIPMMQSVQSGTVNASSGGTVSLTSGAAVSFNAGSFRTSAGTPYTGVVSIAARYLDPTRSTFFDFFPADNLGELTDGSRTPIISCGVLNVEIRDQAGNQLQLDSSIPATLTFPKPPDAYAPQTMPLWYFDETLEVWKEEGSATLQGNVYKGTVTHFTPWNCDYPYRDSSGSISLRIICNGKPIEGVAVSFTQDDGNGPYFLSREIRTDAAGRANTSRLPTNRPIHVEVRSDRNNGFFYVAAPVTITLASSQNADLGDITLSSPCPGTITGTVMCSNAKVSGLVSITGGKYSNYFYTATGDYTFSVPPDIEYTIDVMNESGIHALPATIAPLVAEEVRLVAPLSLCGEPDVYTDIPVNSLGRFALSPDGSRLVFYDKEVKIYDTKSGQLLCESTGSYIPRVEKIYFSRDNSKVLLGTALFDITGPIATHITTIPPATGDPGTTPDYKAILSEDGSKIINRTAKGAFKIYSGIDGSLIKTLSNPLAAYFDFGYRNDINAVIIQKWPTGMSVWSLDEDRQLYEFPVEVNNWFFQYSPDGKTFEPGMGYTGSTSFYDTKTGQKIASFGNLVTFPDGGTGRLEGPVSQHYAFNTIVAGEATIVRLLNFATGTYITKVVPVPCTSSLAYQIAVNTDETHFAMYLSKTCVGYDPNPKVRIWKIKP